MLTVQGLNGSNGLGIIPGAEYGYVNRSLRGAFGATIYQPQDWASQRSVLAAIGAGVAAALLGTFLGTGWKKGLLVGAGTAAGAFGARILAQSSLVER